MDMILDKIAVKSVLLLVPGVQLQVYISVLRANVLFLSNRLSFCCRFVYYAMFWGYSAELLTDDLSLPSGIIV